MADLDAVGNTTKAITKGVAIASAVIAAVSLFASYITDVGRVQLQLGIQKIMTAIRLSETKVFIGLLLGGALPWLFSSLSLRAVTRAAGLIVEEVRRQFRIPGMMEGKVKPDYARVVGISTAAAQKELVPLAVISVLLPIIVGLVLQVEALGGFLAGIILSGQLLAVFMANAGGAWDNAKKSIEDEPGRHRLHGQGLGPPQGRRRRRHGRRSAQGHGRPGPQPDDQGDQPGQPDRRADHRQVQQDDAGPGRHRGRPARRDRLGHLEEQARGHVALRGDRRRVNPSSGWLGQGAIPRSGPGRIGRSARSPILRNLLRKRFPKTYRRIAASSTQPRSAGRPKGTFR